MHPHGSVSENHCLVSFELLSNIPMDNAPCTGLCFGLGRTILPQPEVLLNAKEKTEVALHPQRNRTTSVVLGRLLSSFDAFIVVRLRPSQLRVAKSVHTSGTITEPIGRRRDEPNFEPSQQGSVI